MKSMTIRGVAEDVYGALRYMARANHRSLQEQVKIILEREVRLARGGHVRRAQELRERLKGRRWGDIVSEIRSERNR